MSLVLFGDLCSPGANSPEALLFSKVHILLVIFIIDHKAGRTRATQECPALRELFSRSSPQNASGDRMPDWAPTPSPEYPHQVKRRDTNIKIKNQKVSSVQLWSPSFGMPPPFGARPEPSSRKWRASKVNNLRPSDQRVESQRLYLMKEWTEVMFWES
ncbi:hypothetical protein VTO42DRAFT_4381 [Malbranchea cinnamomea]